MWPLKTIFLHALHPQREAITFPIHTLNDGAVVVAEHKQPRAERIKIHLSFDDRDKAIDSLPHIDRLFVQINRTAITLGS